MTYHLWIDLPGREATEATIAALSRNGIDLPSATSFLPGQDPVRRWGIRLAMGPLDDDEQLQLAASRIKNAIEHAERRISFSV